MSAARFSLRDHPMVVAAIAVTGFAVGTYLAVVVFPASQWGRDIAGLTTAFAAGFGYWIYRKRPGAKTAAETDAVARAAGPQAPAAAWPPHPYVTGVAGFAIVALAVLLIVTFVPEGIWSFGLLMVVIVVTMAAFQYVYRRRLPAGGAQ